MPPQTTSPADFQAYLDAHVIVAPTEAELRRGPRGLGLFVTRPVHQGEEVLRAIEFHIPEDDHTYRARVQLGGSIEEIDVTPMHSVRHENLRAIGLPGCLMNHS